MKKTFKITKERLTELQEELEYCKTVREREVADQIKEARSFGDLSENSEYDEAKNEQGKLYSRMAEIEAVLAGYEIIEGTTGKVTKVATGSTVTVVDMSDKSEETYQVVGSQEADPYQGKISDESPFGKALIGSKSGQIVKVEAPAGVMEYKVKSIK
ncbi:MAG: transcription elongation factor GreA [Clostridia bacterium]